MSEQVSKVKNFSGTKSFSIVKTSPTTSVTVLGVTSRGSTALLKGVVKKTSVQPVFASLVNTDTGSFNKTEQVSSWVPISKFSNDMEFIYPVLVRVEKLEEDIFAAQCPTFNISVLASSYEEALDDLKIAMADDYNTFLGDYPDNLTKDAVSVLRIYRALMGKDLPL